MKKLSFWVMILTLSSCSTSSKIIQLGGNVATQGTEVSKKGVQVYQLIDSQFEIQKNLRDKIKVLENPDPQSLIKLPDTPKEDFSKQIGIRINAYRNLLDIYENFALLSDDKYSSKITEATKNLESSLATIKQIPALNDTQSNLISKITTQISQGIQAKKIKQNNETLFNLTELYVSVWKKDLPMWNDAIDNIYGNYIKELNLIENKVYDAKKVATEFKQPYNDNITVVMYRLKLRDEIITERDKVKGMINDFGASLQLLNMAHAEVSKTETNVSDLIFTLNSITNLLNKK